MKLKGQEAELCRFNWPYFIAPALFSQGSNEVAHKGKVLFTVEGPEPESFIVIPP